MSPDDSNPSNQKPEAEQENQPEGREIEEFFQRLPANFRWPKPNAEAVAAAVEAIHRLSGSAAAQNLAADGELESPGNSSNPSWNPSPSGFPGGFQHNVQNGEPGSAGGATCGACGGSMLAGARFCVWCGSPSQSETGGDAAQFRASVAQHHFHHHYHHLVPGQPKAASGAPSAEAESSAPRGRAPGWPGTSTGGRAEAGARQVVQDWAQACNTKHIDDLIELYSPEATLIRSSVPPVRSLPAIREFLISLLEAGLGDVEMDSLRVELLGDIALDIGRCKMLVPVAMGKRREERGKYLIVLVRQATGVWKILADCWSSDLAVSPPTMPEIPARRGNEPILPPRKPR